MRCRCCNYNLWWMQWSISIQEEPHYKWITERKKSFCWHSYFSNDDKISVKKCEHVCCVLWPPAGLKTGVENDFFGCEVGSGLGKPGGTPPPRIPRATPSGIRHHIMHQVVAHKKLKTMENNTTVRLKSGCSRSRMIAKARGLWNSMTFPDFFLTNVNLDWPTEFTISQISPDNRLNPQLPQSFSLIHLCSQQVTFTVHELIIS